MPPSRPMRRRYGARPAVAGILLVTIIAALALFQSTRSGIIGDGHRQARSLLSPRGSHETDADCRKVHDAADQCAFILANCEDDEAGLIHYLSFYYCTLGSAQPVAFTILAIWLGLLFTTIGIAASDFFSVNLSTISSVLGLSESLAGVTFLAFGNGSPDVFSTFAAMGSNSGSMAIGELIGAAGFITAVVAGSMALVREFKVSKRTFVRDIIFFIIAISFTMVFLADGELHLWECFTMIGFYLFYVAVVVGWHWFTARRRRQRMREVAARAHLYAGSGHDSGELEPYRDEPDEDDAPPVGSRSNSASDLGDVSLLERGPRIEVGGVPAVDDDEEEQKGRHVAAEMASSMRVNRPRWGRSNTTITPIRPSLLGVLEFRSVLSSLQKERNMHLGPLPGRSHSIQQLAPTGLEDPRGRPRNQTMPSHVPSVSGRERALSYGNEPLNLDNNIRFARPDSSPMSHTRNSSTARTIDGMLAPPLGSVPPPDLGSQSPKQGQLLQIRIPSPSGRSSGQSSPTLSPFPGLSESPAALTPLHEAPAFTFPVPADSRHHPVPDLGDQEEQPKPVKWWPYSLLPAPHVLLATIFPTLQGWKEKTWWDKAVSLISVPSIFLLVATLPVVETEDEDNDSVADLADPPEPGHPGNIAPAVLVEHGGEIQPETEWQAYRRRARSVSSRSPLSLSPSSVSLNTNANTDQPADQPPDQPLSLSLPVPQLPKHPGPGSDHLTIITATSSPPSTGGWNRWLVAVQLFTGPLPVPQLPKHPGPGSDHLTIITATSSPPSTGGWNRWLVAVQLFTGPLFVVTILWANTAYETSSSVRTLLRMQLYSLVFSLCLLGALLATTSAHQKPRYHFLLCFLGFVISVAWISTIAGEVVGVLKALGVILGISEAILGLTVFAVGNSLGDLVADVTVARLGYPVMALAACFGGPMLNILLGVGIGGAWMGITKAKKRQRAHPGTELRYKPYRVRVGGSLMISAVTVLLTLVALLIVVPSNDWVMSRRIGWLLIGIWTVGTVVNLVVEMTGTFSDASLGI